MSKIKAAFASFAVLFTAGIAGLFVASPAQAIYPEDCPTAGNGWLCLYHGYFISMTTRYPGDIKRNTCINADGMPETPTLPSTYVYSMVNTTPVEWRWFRDSHCAGASIYIFGGTEVILPTGWTGLAHASLVRTSTVG